MEKKDGSSTQSVETISESSKIEAQRKTDLLAAIAELGGKGMKEEDIVYVGQKLSLPERYRGDLGAAINYLAVKRDEEEEVAVFKRTYNYRPWDGAFNAYQAMKKAFGMVSGQSTFSFFGKNLPQYIQIPVSVTETEEVPWGSFTIPLLENTSIYFQHVQVPDYGLVFNMTVEAPRKHRFVIEGLFKLVEDELSRNSIYRGKAIDGQQQPAFIDLRGFDPSRVVYSQQVLTDLEANLWGVLRYSETNRAQGLSLKRSLLLTGPYGTGKSLAGLRTAIEAQDAGWTFIMARPGRDNFMEVMQTARLYQPAVVFMEDADTIASVEQTDLITELLDTFDGIQAKSTDLVVVMTTNHPDVLHKGMMRPGRVDAIIEIGALDDSGIEQLIRSNISANMLEDSVDFESVCEACAGYMPAFVKEVADRAIRYAISRGRGDLGGIQITGTDLVNAANGLRPQFERMQGAPEFSAREAFGASLEELVIRSTTKAVADLAPAADNTSDDIWDTEILAKAQKAG